MNLWDAHRVKVYKSLSARRAWIEIVTSLLVYLALMSLSARRAWIEMAGPSGPAFLYRSLSARRAWIEIPGFCRITPEK